MESLKNKRKNIISKVIYKKDRPLFRYIEFNLASFCNRLCEFCPITHSNEEKKLIDNNIFYKALDELEELNFDGLIIFSGFSEPFLNKNIHNYISDTKTKLPNSTLLINSNGDVLNEDKIKHIFNLGLDYLSISIYDGPQEFAYFDNIRKKLGYSISIKNRYENFSKNNRAGYLDTQSLLPLSKACFYPFYFLSVNWNGNILFCCHNFLEKNFIGNIENTKLLDVWNSDKMNRLRKIMLGGKRNYIPCNLCDVDGQREGSKYFEEWRRLDAREYR